MPSADAVDSAGDEWQQRWNNVGDAAHGTGGGSNRYAKKGIAGAGGTFGDAIDTQEQRPLIVEAWPHVHHRLHP